MGTRQCVSVVVGVCCVLSTSRLLAWVLGTTATARTELPTFSTSLNFLVGAMSVVVSAGKKIQLGVWLVTGKGQPVCVFATLYCVMPYMGKGVCRGMHL